MDWNPERASNARELENGLSSLLEGIAVTMDRLDAPAAAPRAAQGIHLRLLSVSPDRRDPQQRGARERAVELRLRLRFLATAWADTEVAAADLVCKLAFRLLDMARPGAGQALLAELEDEPVPAALWSALGTPARPSIVLSVPLVWAKKQEVAPRVTSPPRVEAAGSHALLGSVIGPDNSPIAGALVEWPSLHLVCETNVDGLFAFRAVPAEFTRDEIRVRARGIEQSFQVARSDRSSAVTLQLRFTEEK